MTFRSRAAFSLVELLVVIAIIGVLIALLLPALQVVRESGRRTQCSNNLKQVLLAFQAFESSKRNYPPGRLGCDGWNGGICEDVPQKWRNGTSGFVFVLPYLEDGALFDRFNWDNPPYQSAGDGEANGDWFDANAEAIGTRVNSYICPTDGILTEPYQISGTRRFATGSYAMSMGSNGPTYGIDAPKVKANNTGIFMYKRTFTRERISDGLAFTMFLGETIDGHTEESSNVWSRASRHLDSLRNTDNPLNTPTGQGVIVKDSGGQPLYGIRVNGAFASRHPGGAQFAFGDGRVTFMHDEIDLKTYRALSTRALGELFSENL